MLFNGWEGRHPFEEYPIDVVMQTGEASFVFRKDNNVLYEVTQYETQRAFFVLRTCIQMPKKITSIRVEEMAQEDIENFKEKIDAHLQSKFAFSN